MSQVRAKARNAMTAARNSIPAAFVLEHSSEAWKGKMEYPPLSSATIPCLDVFSSICYSYTITFYCYYYHIWFSFSLNRKGLLHASHPPFSFASPWTSLPCCAEAWDVTVTSTQRWGWAPRRRRESCGRPIYGWPSSIIRMCLGRKMGSNKSVWKKTW